MPQLSVLIITIAILIVDFIYLLTLVLFFLKFLCVSDISLWKTFNINFPNSLSLSLSLLCLSLVSSESIKGTI